MDVVVLTGAKAALKDGGLATATGSDAHSSGKSVVAFGAEQFTGAGTAGAPTLGAASG